MGSPKETGGWLPAETRSGAGHEASERAPGGPPPESVAGEDEADLDVSHVTLKIAELKRLLHPKPAAEA